MKKASITQAKNGLSALIRGLKSGPVLIVDRGRPVARLDACGAADGPDAERIDQLVRAGIARLPRAPLPPDFLKARLPRPRRGASIVQAVLDERHEGR